MTVSLRSDFEQLWPKNMPENSEVYSSINNADMLNCPTIQLDGLVMQNCASNIGWLRRIQFERVNKRVLQALKASYNQPISLEIELSPSGIKCSCIWNYCNVWLSSISTSNREAKTTIIVGKILTGSDAKNAIQQIFLRFKTFRILSLVDKQMANFIRIESILDNSGSKLHTSKFRALSYQTKSYDGSLITKFSFSLKKLTITIDPPTSRRFAQIIWVQVTLCKQLKTLEYFPTHVYDRHSSIPMIKCLKSLKLRKFRFYNKLYNPNFLLEAFQENNKLRSILIDRNSFEENFALFTHPSLSTILANLRYLAFKITDRWKAYPNQKAKLLQVLNSLRSNGYLIIHHEIELSQPFVVNCEKDKIFFDVLSFWLQLSAEAKKKIKLCFGFPDTMCHVHAAALLTDFMWNYIVRAFMKIKSSKLTNEMARMPVNNKIDINHNGGELVVSVLLIRKIL
jgi:hypothetical protein